MIKKTAVICLLITITTLTSMAAPSSRVELKDGSSINGEVVSLQDGIYTIMTSALGEIKIGAGSISRIESESPAPNSTARYEQAVSAPSISSQVEGYKKALTANAEISSMISDLGSDKELQNILKDPQIVSAVTSANVPALMGNEKFMDLMNNPKIQEILGKLRHQDSKE
ncbi:MAG: hypothetical protein PHH49_08115 [Candidatus Omnitrophica bacterium]|nr:hypothetical protein [Candidatus Omnitrophota bacterium]MDD5488903.1 hypothetical protein [Candidatus Omnitrophota bacterium]